MKKITYVFVISLLTFLLIVPFVSYKTYKISLKEKVFNHLITARDILKLQIWNYFKERYGDIDVLSRNPVIAQAFTRMIDASRTHGLGSPQFLNIADIYRPIMEHFISGYGYANIFFVEKDGNVIFSVVKEEYSGTNLLTGEFKDFSIADIFMNGLDEVTFEDYTWHDVLNEFTSYFAAPVYESETLLGVLIIEIPFSHLDTMLTQRTGLGQTGEMYLVGDDDFMRSNSRFSEEPTMLQVEVDTEATRDAFDGHVGEGIIKDYRGVSVLSAYTPLDLNYLDWILLVEIDEKEAFAPIHSIETKLTIIASIIGIMAMGYIYLTYKREQRNEVSDH